MDSSMQGSGETSSEKWSGILVTCLLEICIPMEIGGEESEQTIPGAGTLLAYVERIRETFTANKVKDERGCFLSINVSECKNWKKRKLLKLKDKCTPRTSGYKLTIKECSLEIRRKLLAIRGISLGTVSNGRGKERRPACFRRI